MNHRLRIFTAAAALAIAAAPADAQEYSFRTATTVQMGGVVGFAAKLAGAGKESVQTSYLSGHKLRTETGDQATIIDADAGVFTTLDTKKKTYSTMTFDEMAEMLRRLEAQAEQEGARAKARQKESGEADVDIKYSAKVEATGEKEKIGGYDAERLLVTLTMDASARPEGEKDMQHAGNLVILIDTWNSENVPHADASKAFHEAFTRKASRELGSPQRGLEALFGAYPGAKEGLAAAAKEMKKVPGVSVRTTTYMVVVPAEKKFDRELALAGGKKSPEKASDEKSGGFGKKLGGLLGKRTAPAEGSEEGGEQANMEQSTILTVKTELRDVQAGGAPADAFTIPAGYKQEKPRD